MTLIALSLALSFLPSSLPLLPPPSSLSQTPTLPSLSLPPSFTPHTTQQENLKLREQNDDLNGQILSLSLYEAKNLFATQTKAQSLAAEIDNASRDDVSFSFIMLII